MGLSWVCGFEVGFGGSWEGLFFGLTHDAHETPVLAELSGRRHASVEVAMEGSQEQSRGVKRETEAIYASMRDFRSARKDAVTVTEAAKKAMDILKELSQIGSKMHNGFAGLSAMARSTTATVAEGKEAAERTLEVAEQTLAVCRVSGPSPSEKEILEAIGETQVAMQDTKAGVESLEASLEALRQLVSTPIPPPQHAPNLLNVAHAGSGAGWGQPTAAVMLGNPQQIFRVLAGDGAN